jgi:tripartite-type tricarboxylate transporter receptor subunit TctC
VNLKRRQLLQCAGVGLAASALSRFAWSQAPARTVRIVVSSLPGGGPDIASRLLAHHLSARWGRPVVVENRPGAAGNIGAGEVAAAQPDGYTLLPAHPSPLTTNIFLYRKLNFDPTAFAPVIVVTTLPNVLVVRRDFLANDVAFLRLSRRRANRRQPDR